MSTNTMPSNFGRLTPVLFIVVASFPTALFAQETIETTWPAVPQSLPSVNVQTIAWGQEVVDDQETLQQITDRLEAAEAEILSLQQDAVAPCAATAPENPSYLVPLTMDCERGSITFKPGARIQTRYLYDDGNNNNDIFVRRFRLKSSGNLFGIAKYGTELKIDSTGKIRTDPEPEGIVENAWLDFTLFEEWSYLRVGLYDIPFSRNALTSDSKLLFMDRTLIKGTLTTLGMADNTIGLLFHGRPRGGQLEYSVGVFDNVRFEPFNPTGSNSFDPTRTSDSTQLMPAGRIVLNLLDPAEPSQAYADYKGSYIGEGQRLALGANAAYLGNATFDTTAVPVTEFDLTAWGVDLFFNKGSFVAQAEYDWFEENMASGTPDVRGDGWFAQVGVLLFSSLELAGRYEEADILAPAAGSIAGRLERTSVGLNYYYRDHNLKIQADYGFRREGLTEINNDVFQLQLQMDY